MPSVRPDADISAPLRTHRHAADLTQRQLAQQVGVDPATISRIERGVVQPRYLTLAALAKELGVEVEDLAGGDVQ